MNAQAETKRRAQPFINVTLLIDVLLVLLIIFMVITPHKPARFKTLAPQQPTRDERIPPNTNTLVVTIERDSHLSLNGEKNIASIDDMSRLNAELARVFSERRATRLIRADAELRDDLPDEERLEKRSSSKLRVRLITARSRASWTALKARARIRLACRLTIWIEIQYQFVSL